MSMFLPEGMQGTPSGVASITPASPAATEEDTRLMQRVLAAAASHPNLIPDVFMSYVLDYIQTQNLVIPISQVFGFANFTLDSAPAVASATSTNSLTFVDGSPDIGPTINGIGAGRYFVLWGCGAYVSAAGGAAQMGLSVNGATPTASCQSGAVGSAQATSITAFEAVTLAGAANTISCQYATTNVAVTASFSNRQLVVLRFANL